MRLLNQKRYSLTFLALLPSLLMANSDKVTIDNGEYIFNMSGCASCHTTKGGEPLAGGLAMQTPFGTFYTPNISPDKTTGIGDWSEEEFIRAMTDGESPDGSHYYPAFPYTSYAKMSKSDLLDLKRYLDKQPAIKQKSKSHVVGFPFSYRPLLGFWKLINFEDEPFKQNNNKSSAWNRGAYIVNGPGHCGECHSPRNLLGGVKSDEALAGNPEGPEGEAVPGLKMTKENRVSQWSDGDLLFSLQIGMTPDGDFLGGSMGHVIENSTGKLSEKDLKAVVEYLRNGEG